MYNLDVIINLKIKFKISFICTITFRTNDNQKNGHDGSNFQFIYSIKSFYSSFLEPIKACLV